MIPLESSRLPLVQARASAHLGFFDAFAFVELVLFLLALAALDTSGDFLASLSSCDAQALCLLFWLLS